jgi:hypothetical protein
VARPRRTLEEASRRNAERHNQRQRDRLPLFIQAGLEDDLLTRGLLQDRAPDHLLNTQTAYLAQLSCRDPEVWDRSARLQAAFKRLCPARYPDALRHWRALRSRHASLRRAADNADHWYGLLARHLSRPELLAWLDQEWPQHAQTLRYLWRIDAALARKAERGRYNGWGKPLPGKDSGCQPPVQSFERCALPLAQGRDRCFPC